MSDKITYLIEKADKTKMKITVPADWKVTFGPASKGSNAPTTGEQRFKMPLALRFYESETKQRAIFTDVISFRDMSIPIEIETVKVQEKDGFMECDGARKRTIFQATVKTWENPDGEKEVPKLPKDAEIFDLDN